MKSQRQGVFVGMSGGVDSSVSAALLKKAGYSVTGVFIKVWQPDWLTCTWRHERLEAMRAAAHLDIPFLTLDLESQYKKDVIDHMIAEYRAGRTPNPDVMCNRYVKFGAFAEWARKQGADYIATGHYARVEQSDRIRVASYKQDTRCNLLAGKDSNKDQSYFLWTLKQDDLKHILFPVGHLTKPEVRRLAKKFGLPNADKKDSQGLCFIGKIDVKEFLAHYIQAEPGNVLNQAGETIGTHQGALFFTIGERHGFRIDRQHHTSSDQPYYVVDKDVEQNTITVSNKRAGHLQISSQRHVQISSVNWVGGEAVTYNNIDPTATDSCTYGARSRYRQPLQAIRSIVPGISGTWIEFVDPQDTLTPGQSLVIYRGDECVAGGIISEVRPS
ncbi:MAG: tRNA 2-thiouridine(34) synthase MnmA [Patescibacteria group bacterium]|nr:tRNA 2-thiouridine(34) synthase MnmA [Patescibacteria group bacterium]MDE2172880.1 tRNA 2-thiouridine(34) synthase MnmA [Patescibacteria group bacterium]